MMRRLCGCLPVAVLTAAQLGVGSFLAAPAFAQTGRPEALGSALVEALAFVTGGLVAPQEPTQLTRDGETYRISIPLPGLTSPPNAAIDAVARPLDGAAWDVTSLTLPPTGTIPIGGAGDRAGTLSFSLGQQAIHAKVDPSLALPSPFAGELRDISLLTDNNGQHIEQSIDRYNLGGTVSAGGTVPAFGEPRLNVESQGSAENWRIDTRDKAGATVTGLINSTAGSFNVEELDRSQAARLTTAARSVAADMQTVHGAPPGLLTCLGILVDAFPGLLSRLDAEETLERMHFDAGGTNQVDIGQVRMGLTSEVRMGRLNARFVATVDDPILSAIPADVAPYVPRHVDIEPAVSGVPTELLLRLLRDATAADPDQTAIGIDLNALLDDPDARLGVESLEFSSGPLQVTGSGLLRKQTDGKAGINIHLVATGVDALVADAQDNPNMQTILPLVFIAKGMARSVDDSLVWDIALGDSGVTVNGMPFGQPPPDRSAPSNR
jgi:hypothetical protein